MGLENSESIRHTAAEAAGAFSEGAGALAESFVDVFKRPVQGAAQLAGSELAVEKKPQHESMAASVGHTAGSILGNAVLFVGMTSALGRIPGIGRAASYAVGGALGFLQPTTGDQGIGTRFANAALGAGMVGLLDVGPAALGAAKSTWIPNSQIAGWIPESQLGRVAVANAGIGALNTQLDSVIHTGRVAGLSQTILGSALWAGTGAGAHGLGNLIGRGDASPLQSQKPGDAPPTMPAERSQTAPDVVPLERQATTVRISELGVAGPVERQIQVPAGSPTANIFKAAENGAVRIETMVARPEGGVLLKVATGFAVKDPRDQLRVITTNHLLKADPAPGQLLDVSIFDSQGRAMKGARVAGSDAIDTSVLAVDGGSQLKPLQLSDRSVKDIAAEDNNFLLAGYPNGGKDLTLMNSQHLPTPKGEDTRIFAPTAQEGDCGSAYLSMSDGTVAGMYKNASSSTAGVSHITEAASISRLLQRSADEPVQWQSAGPVESRMMYPVGDRVSGQVSIRNILDKKFSDRGQSDFMHSHVLRIPLNENGQKLGLQIQYLPVEGRLSMRPLMLDDEKLIGNEYWPRTNIAILDAHLNIPLQGETPLHVETINDPHHVLMRSLNAVDSSGYLANLEPTKENL